MSDKRLYPNTVIFKGTDDNEITYINERVLEQIRAEIENQLFVGRILNSKDFDDGLKWCLDIIDKYTQ